MRNADLGLEDRLLLGNMTAYYSMQLISAQMFDQFHINTH